MVRYTRNAEPGTLSSLAVSDVIAGMESTRVNHDTIDSFREHHGDMMAQIGVPVDLRPLLHQARRSIYVEPGPRS